jgi:hypothetical protein
MSFRYPEALTKTCYTKNRPRRQHGSLKKVIISCSLELEEKIRFAKLWSLRTWSIWSF